MALAKGARMQGATDHRGRPGRPGSCRSAARVTGVRTAYGDIEAEYVVNCAGMWARQLGAQGGRQHPAASRPSTTTSSPRRSRACRASLPVLEDPGSYGYFREEVGGLMVGLFEPVCAPWKVDGVPEDFSFGEIPPDWDRMAPYVEKAMRRVPDLARGRREASSSAARRASPRTCSPIVGEAPELKNYFVAAGLNSIGILTGGGLGRVLAHWIINGRPDVDVTGFNIDRLHTYQANPEYRRTRTVESLGMVYQCHYPTRSMQTARGAKQSPFHDRLAARGAYFNDVSGWEGATGTRRPASEPKIRSALSWGRQHWFPYWEAEHEADARGRDPHGHVVHGEVPRPGARRGRAAQPHLGQQRRRREPGVITYTQWLNEGGKLEADLTVTKLDDERYWVVASDTAHRHVETWMRRHIPDDAHAFVTDVTSGYAQLNVQGPRSRELLQSVTTRDLSNEAFPFRAAREIDIGFARALCVRITYLGRARLRAVHPDRAGDARLRPPRRGGRGVRPAPRGPQGARAACAWRRATATTATTSTTPTRCSRRAWASRST